MEVDVFSISAVILEVLDSGGEALRVQTDRVDRGDDGGVFRTATGSCGAIAEQMGLVDGGALVLKRYGHLYSGARRQAALALEAHVFAPRPDPAVEQLWDGDPPT